MNAGVFDGAAGALGVWLRLGPRHSAPRAARKLAYDMCEHAGSPASLVDNAAFVVGELVRTSISQARSDLTVQLSCQLGQVTVRVRDAGSSSPVRMSDIDASAARCWDIVRRLCASWGFSDQSSGREMWATLRDDSQRIVQIAA